MGSACVVITQSEVIASIPRRKEAVSKFRQPRLRRSICGKAVLFREMLYSQNADMPLFSRELGKFIGKAAA